jgi:DNA polymerase III sliding clamp (beta) subunit (PCNA family)
MSVTKITATEDNKIKCKLVLFSDDEILIITIPNTTAFIKVINGEFTHINSKLKANSSLNLESKSLIQFLTKSSSRNALLWW